MKLASNGKGKHGKKKSDTIRKGMPEEGKKEPTSRSQKQGTATELHKRTHQKGGWLKGNQGNRLVKKGRN